jgi:SLT domain-containing protein
MLESHRSTPSRLWALVPPLLAIAALALAPVARAEPRPPAPVPCSDIGGGKHQCSFYPAGDGISGGAPVQAHDGGRVGYLNHGNNWVICEAVGSSLSSGPYTNYWWAWTEANNGHWGWVNALYGQGGENDGDFGGVPPCDGSQGSPPGAAAPAPPPPPSGPAPVPCSPTAGGKFNCNFYMAGNGISGGTPVQAGDGHRVGYLNVGTNWVVCQSTGAEVAIGPDHNNWWAWTEADNGNWGWVNAVYGGGGANDGPFAGVPACGGAHGSPPNGGGGAPPPPPPPSGGVCSSASDPAGDNVSRWTPVVVCVLNLLGQNTAQNVSDMLTLIQHESSGNPDAINRTDINWQQGHPSQGLTQVIPSNFVQYGNPSLSSNILDPAANIYAGANYSIHRYGSIHDAKGLRDLRNTGRYTWYALPGLVHPLHCGRVPAHGEELTVSARAITCPNARGVAKALAGARTVLARVARAALSSPSAAFHVRARRAAFTCRGVRYSSAASLARGTALYALSCTSGHVHVVYGAEASRRGGRQP